MNFSHCDNLLFHSFFQIVHVEAGYTKAVHMNFHKESNKLVPFELIIQNSTELNFIGNYTPQADNNAEIEPTVLANYSDFAQANGYISKFIHIIS